MSELVVENVQKWLGGLQILKGASFTAGRGSILALLGASGSGKTTLLRCVAGLEQPEIGRIRIGEQTVLDHERRLVVPPERRNIGLVFQSYALWPHRTVAENVGYGLKLRGIDKAEMGRRIQALLGKLGLGQLAGRYPSQLSGGQQQRVAICRALIYEPQVLLMDEPLSNLDAKLREEARYFIRNLILELELCAILVTHDQAEALATSDRILLLKDGVIVQEGAPTEIYARPTSFYAADFLGTNNVFAGRIEHAAGAVRLCGEDWAIPGVAMNRAAPGSGRAVVRVERITVHTGPAPGRLAMTLEDCLYLGDHWEYRLRHGALRIKATGATALPPGTVHAEIPPDSVWIYADG
jgi:iron(III) transport system ATP-binding protein